MLNRRGYHNILRCKECGEVVKCPHCDLAMSYHYKENVMKCHTCGTMTRIPKICPSCHSDSGFATFGYGTEKLLEVVQNTFKDARILRMDRDSTS